MNNVEKIDDCTVRIEKGTILVLASRMVSFYLLLLFLGERYEYWFISIFTALSLRHL